MWRLAAGLSVIAAAPAAAQPAASVAPFYEADGFAVHQSMSSCVLQGAWPNSTGGEVEASIAYDARARRISLMVSSEVASLLEYEGATQLSVWFDRGANTRPQDAWGKQLFYYSKGGKGYEFSAELSGAEADRFLDAFETSSSFGLSYEREMFLLVALRDSAKAIATLRDCATAGAGS